MLIPPDVRARLRELRLVARAGAGGVGLGQHASRSRGAGLEFAQYRAYEPGDEPRRIDWKLYARSDRYFVREAERDSPLTIWLLLDATASMRQADAARPDFTKLDAAKTLAACVIELALRQGDRFGLITTGGRMPPTDVPRPHSGRGGTIGLADGGVRVSPPRRTRSPSAAPRHWWSRPVPARASATAACSAWRA